MLHLAVHIVAKFKGVSNYTATIRHIVLSQSEHTKYTVNPNNVLVDQK
jgi:hypothetical protein